MTTTEYLYEDNGPIKEITYTDTTNSNIIEQFAYTFDDVSNVDTMTDTSGLHDYGYDDLYRLTSAVHPAGAGLNAENYSYDEVGNREDPVDSLLYDYDANNRILKSPDITGYTYDDDGNTLTKAGGEALTYSYDNRLATYTDGSNNASYKYDIEGRRISKTVNGQTTWYLWDGSNLLAEYSDAGVLMKRYAYLPIQLTPVQMADASGVYNAHTDNLQTPKRLTDSNRITVWQANYESFGEVVLTGSVEFNFRFPGQYYDAESGLHYNYFRDYDPSIGRYVESDPIGLEGGINTYAYAKNNPLIMFDSSGLAPVCRGQWVYMGFNPQLPRILRLCTCYWLCLDCEFATAWSGAKESLPSTTGQLIFDPTVGGSGAGDIEAGNECLCRSKPGPEEQCDDCSEPSVGGGVD